MALDWINFGGPVIKSGEPVEARNCFTEGDRVLAHDPGWGWNSDSRTHLGSGHGVAALWP